MSILLLLVLLSTGDLLSDLGVVPLALELVEGVADLCMEIVSDVVALN